MREKYVKEYFAASRFQHFILKFSKNVQVSGSQVFRLFPSKILYNRLENYLSLSMKTFTLYT